MRKRVKNSTEIKNTNKINFIYNENIGSISRIFLSSFMVVSFFYIMPVLINYADKNMGNARQKTLRVFSIRSLTQIS